MIPAMQPNMGTPNSAALPPLPSSLKILFVGVDSVLARNRTGTGDQLTKSSPNMTLIDAGGGFTADDVPQWITLSGWSNAGNNGTFVTNLLSGTDLRFTNSAGVAEVSATGTWRLHGRITSITDRVGGFVAVPTTTATALCADGFTLGNGKILMSNIGAALVAQGNIAPDIGGLIASLGNSNMAMYQYGRREALAAGVMFSLISLAGTHFIRAQFAGTNVMRMGRNDGTNNSSDIATNASIATTSPFAWGWTWDNAGGALLQAFRSGTSMGAPVAPSSARRPNDLVSIRLGSTVVGEGQTTRGFGVFNTTASAADQNMVTAYLDAVYA